MRSQIVREAISVQGLARYFGTQRQTDIMLLLHKKGIFFLGIITDDDLRITFDYGFLAPPLLDAEVLLDFEKTCKDLERSDSTTRHARPETEALWYMSQSQVGNLIIHKKDLSVSVCTERSH